MSEGDKKGWCVGSDYYIAKDRNIHIFFHRQFDALRFMKQFSVFKKPTFYFDYFNSDRREMPVEEIVQISDKYFGNKTYVEELSLDTNSPNTSNDLSYTSFQLMDWEKYMDEDGYCVDADLTKEELIDRLEKYKLF